MYLHSHLSFICFVQPSIMLPEAVLWKSLFEEPAMWFDKRPTMNNRPAFVHSQHHYPLWLGHRTPREAIEEVQRLDDLNEGRWAKVLVQTVVSHHSICYTTAEPQRTFKLLDCSSRTLIVSLNLDILVAQQPCCCSLAMIWLTVLLCLHNQYRIVTPQHGWDSMGGTAMTCVQSTCTDNVQHTNRQMHDTRQASRTGTVFL